MSERKADRQLVNEVGTGRRERERGGGGREREGEREKQDGAEEEEKEIEEEEEEEQQQQQQQQQCVLSIVRCRDHGDITVLQQNHSVQVGKQYKELRKEQRTIVPFICNYFFRLLAYITLPFLFCHV